MPESCCIAPEDVNLRGSFSRPLSDLGPEKESLHEASAP